jgi:UDPglucose--hexose-1-phosphate uridylyltransferase
VIIAPGRAARPHDFVDKPVVERRGDCPFCGGNEALTTRELDALREPGTSPTGPGWRVRSVPNKYPFLNGVEERESGRSAERENRNASLPFSRSPDLPLWSSYPATGPHEVLIDSPRHVVRASELSTAESLDVLRLYRLRLRAMRAEAGVRFVQIFKNVGEGAGASIEHLHSHLAALDVVPPDVVGELTALAAYRKQNQNCAYCDLVAAELAAGVRVVEATPRFVVTCPYASGFSYEMHVTPRAHSANFHEIDDAGLAEVAEVLQRSLLRLECVVDEPAYNLLLKTAPFDSFGDDHYHWRMVIAPRLNKAAGFEWATGILVNPLAPEDAAGTLRAADGSNRTG